MDGEMMLFHSKEDIFMEEVHITEWVGKNQKQAQKRRWKTHSSGWVELNKKHKKKRKEARAAAEHPADEGDIVRRVRGSETEYGNSETLQPD